MYDRLCFVALAAAAHRSCLMTLLALLAVVEYG
jgi:hypothetical protein